MGNGAETRLSAFVGQFAERSAERDYYSFLAEILAELDINQNDPQTGFGLIRLLYGGNIVAKDGREIDPGSAAVMGSVEDVSRIVAVVLSDVSNDPIWWKARYVPDISSDAAKQVALTIMDQVRRLPFIASAELCF